MPVHKIIVAQQSAAPPAIGDYLVYVDFASVPSSTGNGGVYTGSPGSLTLDLTAIAGTPFQHFSSGGWNNTGYGRFSSTNDSSGGIYRGFNASYSGSPSQLNLRFLMRWNTAFGTTDMASAKGNYFTLGGDPFWSEEKTPSGFLGTKQQLLSYEGTLQMCHGNGADCQDIIDSGSAQTGALCNGADSGLGDGVAAAGPFEFAEWSNQWVCMEHQISSGRYYQYIWTQDRTYNGLYMFSHLNPVGGPGITGFSGMYYCNSSADGLTIDVAQVVIDDVYIGPPVGF